MDMISPFIEAMKDVMPQLGFSTVEIISQQTVEPKLLNKGVMILVGIMGDIKGSFICNMSEESAKQITSVLMMGLPITELDEMTQSAIAELSNMLSANATIKFTKYNKHMDISPPTLMLGKGSSLRVTTKIVSRIATTVNGIPVDLLIAAE